MSKLTELKDDAVEEFKDHLFNCLDLQERLEYLQEDEPTERFSEIADGQVPVYTADSMGIASEDTNISMEKSDLCENGTPLEIINANIYEAIQAELWDYWRNEKDEIKEETQEIINALEELEIALSDPNDERLDTQIVTDVAEGYTCFSFYSDEEVFDALEKHRAKLAVKQARLKTTGPTTKEDDEGKTS